MVEGVHDLDVAARLGDELRRQGRARARRHLDGGRIGIAGGDQARVARPAEEAVAVCGVRDDGRRERRAERAAGGGRRGAGLAAIDLHVAARSGARRDEVLHLPVHLRVDSEARLPDARVLGGDPFGRGCPAPKARLVERASKVGLGAVRIAPEGERQAVIGRDGRNAAPRHRRTVAEDRQYIPVVGERDEPPVRRHVGEAARHVLAVLRRPRREQRRAAVGHLDLPAVVVRVGVLAREDARVANDGIRLDPGGHRERPAQRVFIVVRDGEVAPRVGRRRAAALSDRALYGAARSGRTLRRRHKAVPGGVRDRAARLGHVPHAHVAGAQPHRIRRVDGQVRRRRAVAEEDRRVAGELRHAHPDERRALRVPRLDVVRQHVAVHIREAEGIRRAGGVGEPDGLPFRQLHEHGEVFKGRLGRIPAELNRHAVRKPRNVKGVTPHRAREEGGGQGQEARTCFFHHVP